MKRIFLHHAFFVVLWNLLLVLVSYSVCRLEFLLENWSLFSPDLTWGVTFDLFRGGMLFDGAALAYTNLLYVVLALFPLHWKERPVYHTCLKVLFVCINALAIAINLADSVFFPFNKQRATVLIFDEFQNENNLFNIIGVELVRHWYLVLLAALLIYGLWRCYCPLPASKRPLWRYYLSHSLSLIVLVLLGICAMRGKYFDTQSRPMAINDAHKYTVTPMQTGIVLNTPFAIVRTLHEKPISLPTYFTNQAELDSLYSPLHQPDSNRIERRKNVVILIVESFAQEFIGSRNPQLDGGSYRGYTPFADSLLARSLTWRETFCNGGVSIDAMPSVLASIPRMDRPYVLQPYSLNDINSIATELGRWNYHSAFFHGAPNGSMGFEAFAHSAGFDEYVGLTEYCEDSRFGGRDDFDGTWAIWDEPFLQFCATRMSEMQEPFVTAIFTASSHHPFEIPEAYRDTFPDEGLFPLHKCVRYTDHSLRRFFETASQQPWYRNTLFVLTADHASSRITHDVYKTQVGLFRIPILFFDPSGEMPVGCCDGIAQQIDIMPTLLNYLGYDHPYIAFGKDLLNTSPEEAWAFNWEHIPQFIQGDYTLLFDGEKVKGFYDYRDDPLLQHDLQGASAEQQQMTRRIKAILQSYMQRMKDNDITVKKQ